MPRGFFVPVTPGTGSSPIGGAIASDIHGKNHHVDGSFGNHVEAITLLLADGSTRVHRASTRDPALFWATVGGMGLTGVILDATIRLFPIETSRMRVDTARVADLDALLATMSDGDDDVRYCVAWIDLVAKGRHLGRSVLTRGDHARLDDLDARQSGTPLDYGPHQLVRRAAARSADGRAQPRHRRRVQRGLVPQGPSVARTVEIQGIGAFFHPLDLVGSWNRLYGSRGMVQYQFVVPFGQEDALRTVVERLSASGAASFLAVLKRFGAANPAPLSFPQRRLDARARRAGRFARPRRPAARPRPDRARCRRPPLLRQGCAHDSRSGAPRLPTPRRVEGGPRAKSTRIGVWQSDLGRRLGLI